MRKVGGAFIEYISYFYTEQGLCLALFNRKD